MSIIYLTLSWVLFYPTSPNECVSKWIYFLLGRQDTNKQQTNGTCSQVMKWWIKWVNCLESMLRWRESDCDGWTGKISEEVTFEMRSESNGWRERNGHLKFFGNNISGRRDSRCKALWWESLWQVWGLTIRPVWLEQKGTWTLLALVRLLYFIGSPTHEFVCQ